jgi:hypothetical protein
LSSPFFQRKRVLSLSHKRYNGIVKTFSAIKIIPPLICLCFSAPGMRADSPSSKAKLEQEARVAGYVIRIFRNEEARIGTLQFLKNGKIKFKRTEDSKYMIGLVYEDSPGNKLIPPGKDINGDGVPDVVISEWTQGAHCCFLFHIFSLSENVKEIAVIDAEHGDLSGFVDPHHNGVLDFKAADWTFAYWNAGFAQSPAPEILLKWDGSNYRLDIDLMRKAPMDEKVLKASAIKVKADENWTQQFRDCVPNPDLWRTMLDLIYSGNEVQAWQFAEMAWNPACPGYDQFLKDFKIQLATSHYWKDVQALNHRTGQE